MKVRAVFLTVCFSLLSFLGFAQEIAVESVVDENLPEASESAAAAAENTPDVPETPQQKYLVFRASSEKIRMLETDTDIFSAAHVEEKKRVLTDIAGGELLRRFYDENLRLQKAEYWQIASSSAQSKLERVLDYNYNNEGKINSVKENDFSAKTQSLTFFTQSGKIKSQRKNQLVDDKVESFEVFTFEYNADDKILQEKRQLFEVKNNRDVRVLTQVTVNKYSGENLLETSFYENSVLRLRTVYQNGKKEDYIQTIYFDGGITVREFYKEGVKVSATISNQNGGGVN